MVSFFLSAGASALPQNSLVLNERGAANFDLRHRFSTYFIYDFSALEDIEEVLDPNIFFRANRQAIVHINSIQSVRPHGNQKLLVQIKSPLKLEIDINRERAGSIIR